ncbi:MAG TPA: hypoxanthine phosphoribosyltransferase [Candidatus Binatia bacterium]|nr:hypoxanthine phosphoribosyltransferase [Candidatus Binatia bacterium]
MNPAKVLPSLTPVYSRKEIGGRVRELARALSRSFAGKEPIIVGVLQGAFLFVADLVREMRIPVKMDFVQVGSYGQGTKSTGTLHLVKDLGGDIAGQDVILVDTVLDTGLTLRFLLDLFARRHPRSLTTCVLIDKRQRRQVEVTADHVGFVLADGFVVGYGLDYRGSYRNLDGVYHLKDEGR